jgi:hypothetical protein
MFNNPTQLVQKLWNFCSLFHKDNLSPGVVELEEAFSMSGINFYP